MYKIVRISHYEFGVWFQLVKFAYGADEVCLTSTTVELVAVKSVDGRPVGTDKAGPVTARMFQQFHKLFAGG